MKKLSLILAFGLALIANACTLQAASKETIDALKAFFGNDADDSYFEEKLARGETHLNLSAEIAAKQNELTEALTAQGLPFGERRAKMQEIRANTQLIFKNLQDTILKPKSSSGDSEAEKAKFAAEAEAKRKADEETKRLAAEEETKRKAAERKQNIRRLILAAAKTQKINDEEAKRKAAEEAAARAALLAASAGPAGAGSGAGDADAGSGHEVTSPVEMPSFVGLQNTHYNDCFINAMLQCVFSSPSHITYLRSLFNDPDFDGKITRLTVTNPNAPTTGEVTSTDLPKYQALALSSKTLFDEYLKGVVSEVTSRNFTDALRKRSGDKTINPDLPGGGYGQGDAGEAYMVLMNTLAYVNPRLKLDHVVIRTTTTCEPAGHVSEKNEDEATLNVELFGAAASSTVQTLINNFEKEEHLDNTSTRNPVRLSEFQDNRYYCESCGSKQNATKKITVLPPRHHLVVYLKRTEFNFTTLALKKNMLKIIPSAEVSLNEVRYKLTGVANHGGDATGGHWTAWANRGDEWKNISDSTVSSFTGNFSEGNESVGLLIYERIP